MVSNKKYSISQKFRPITFSQLLGQSKTSTIIKHAINNGTMGHAYLFYGQRGCGKTTTARLIARRLNCTNTTTEEPCNTCLSCQQSLNNNHLNIIEIDAASNRGIEDIRSIKESLQFQLNAGHKVYIIDEVHMLTKEAFNALLKTLEEPPEYVTFIFATTDIHKVPDTILSRCQTFHLSNISESTIQQKLKHILDEQNIIVDDKALELISKHANGSLRDAESILEQCLAFENYESLTLDCVNSFLGSIQSDLFHKLDQIMSQANLDVAIEIIKKITSDCGQVESVYHQLFEYYVSQEYKGTLENKLLILSVIREDLKMLNQSSNELVHIQLTIIAIINVYTLPSIRSLQSPLSELKPIDNLDIVLQNTSTHVDSNNMEVKNTEIKPQAKSCNVRIPSTKKSETKIEDKNHVSKNEEEEGKLQAVKDGVIQFAAIELNAYETR